MTIQCFGPGIDPGLMDRAGFLFDHHLVDHPALSLESLAGVIPRLSPRQVFHSSGRLSNTDNFDRAHLEHRPAAGLETALENLRTTDGYIMVRRPETDPAFKPLFDALRSEVGQLVAAAGIPRAINDAMLYLFIASPNSVTPFHIDRYSTFLMQCRGSKVVTVYSPWDARVVDDEDTEHFFANTGRRPVWRPETEILGQQFDFRPGQALHIPFVAGHHVRNGSEDVSISLSIIFKTARTRQLVRAMLFNHYSRASMARLGMRPRRVALDHPGIASKAAAWRAFTGPFTTSRSIIQRAGGKLSAMMR